MQPHCQDTPGQTYSIDTGLLNDRYKTSFELFLKGYADSLNKLNSSQLPEFIKNTQFDIQYSLIWSTSNEYIDLRYLIFQNVTNCQSLKLILNEKSDIYRRLPHVKGKKINQGSMSVYKIAKERFEELSCK